MAIATFHMLNSHMWPVATVMDNADKEYCYYHRKLNDFHHCTAFKVTFLNFSDIIRFSLKV